MCWFLLKLGFNFYLDGNSSNLSLGTIFYGSSYIFNGFIVMDIDYNKCNLSYSMITSLHNCENELNIWHAQLGHIGQDGMDRLVKEGLLPTHDKVDFSTYKYCLIGKSTKKLFGKGIKTKFPLKLVHLDICCLMNVRARHELSILSYL